MTRGKPIQSRRPATLDDFRSSSEKDFDSRPRPFGTLFARAPGWSDAAIAAVSLGYWPREPCRGYPGAPTGRLLSLRPKMLGVHRRSSQDGGDPAAGGAASVNASSDPQSAPMVASPSSLSVSSTPLHVLAHASTQERKRSVSASAERPAKRKIVKVTRACDICKAEADPRVNLKARKARCSGTLPCDSCVKRGRSRDCHYDAKYSRGRPVSPPRVPDRRDSYSSGDRDAVEGNGYGRQGLDGSNAGVNTRFLAVNAPMEPIPQPEQRGGNETSAPSRASPELEVSEIQGQYHDTTSGLAFLHRACRRLSKEASAQAGRYNAPVPSQPENEDSPTLTVGDKPLGRGRQGHVEFPPLQLAKQLVHLYSDVCMATYRFTHLQTVEAWLDTMSSNDRDGLPLHRGVGRAKAAIVLTMLAIAKSHEDKASGRFQMDEEASMEHTDALFSDASALVQQETASPTLESAQARLIQVLYLLTTSRFNQAWYVFGTAIQLISALGLHRRPGRKPREVPKGNYIEMQLRKRTFWSAYILDKYLGVIFGRPRHYNDEDIDQEAPDSVNDEDMTPTGPIASHQRGKKDCHVDALIYHSRIGTIISEAARTVYSIKQISHKERITAAHRLGKDLQRWRESLPPYLGSIHPSSLIPTFRRQSITLRIAYCHAIMHMNRLFLLGKVSSGSEPQIREAIIAATTVLETVDEMVNEQGTIFHAFWWTHYVAFCALAIVYAWEVQSRKTQPNVVLDAGISHSELMALAEKCHKHLAQATASNSPSRRYSLILEKLRREAIRGIMPRHAPSANVRRETEEGAEIRGAPVHSHATPSQTQEAPFPSPASRPQSAMELNSTPQNGFGATFEEMNWSLQEWQSEDWLNLDSMAFGTFSESYDAPFVWNTETAM